MERLRENAPVLVTALLALLLLAYVFAGGGGGKQRSEGLARCASSEAFDVIKADLFRQAAALRGSNDPAFQQLTGYSVLRAESQIVRKSDDKSRTVTCSGTLVLDIPPGVEVIGGRRSLPGKLTYVLAGREGSRPDLRSLANADAIAVPLATVATSGSSTGQALPPPVPPEQQMIEEEEGAARPVGPAQMPPPPVARQPRPEARPSARPTARPTAPPPRAVQKPRPERATVVRQPPKPAPTVQATPPANAAVKPSFNCRYARRYGEIAACRDAGLASLDRQMAAQFHRALAGASPGARTMLERSRNRFLRSRDACRSYACVAAAYRQRIAEINSIMAGGF